VRLLGVSVHNLCESDAPERVVRAPRLPWDGGDGGNGDGVDGGNGFTQRNDEVEELGDRKNIGDLRRRELGDEKKSDDL
jgi:hypothetical protein